MQNLKCSINNKPRCKRKSLNLDKCYVSYSSQSDKKRTLTVVFLAIPPQESNESEEKLHITSCLTQLNPRLNLCSYICHDGGLFRAEVRRLKPLKTLVWPRESSRKCICGTWFNLSNWAAWQLLTSQHLSNRFSNLQITVLLTKEFIKYVLL